MNSILDTHIVLWIVFGSERLRELPWLDRYRPWGISPVALLETVLLVESGRFDADVIELNERLREDPRFVIDDLPLDVLVRNAIPLTWTRDPFDRLLSAHSSARRTPLCTVDRRILQHHQFVPDEVTPR